MRYHINLFIEIQSRIRKCLRAWARLFEINLYETKQAHTDVGVTTLQDHVNILISLS